MGKSPSKLFGGPDRGAALDFGLRRRAVSNPAQRAPELIGGELGRAIARESLPVAQHLGPAEAERAQPRGHRRRLRAVERKDERLLLDPYVWARLQR